jgi:hypothetical protein
MWTFALSELESGKKFQVGHDQFSMPVDGRLVIGVLATPFIYGSLKSAYWSNQLKKLNDREVISERYVFCMVDCDCI